MCTVSGAGLRTGISPSVPQPRVGVSDARQGSVRGHDPSDACSVAPASTKDARGGADPEGGRAGPGGRSLRRVLGVDAGEIAPPLGARLRRLPVPEVAVE